MRSHNEVATVLSPGGRGRFPLCRLGVVFGLLISGAGQAQDRGGRETRQVETLLSRLADRAETLRLEADLADRIARDDRAGIGKLAASLDQAEAGALRLLAEPKRKLALRVGPCHLAALHLRAVIRQIGAGEAGWERRGGELLILDTDADDEFARSMRMCEILAKAPVTPRRIGSQCLVNGSNCEGGPQ